MPRLVLILVLAVACIACSDSSSPTAPTEPTPAPTPTPEPSDCTLSPVDFRAEFTSEVPDGFAYQVKIGTAFAEIGTRAWWLNRATLTLTDAAGNVLEEPSLGADDVTAALGDNRIDVGGAEAIILDFPFNATGISEASVLYEFNDEEDRSCDWTLNDIEVRVAFP